MLVGDIQKFETLEDGGLLISGIASTPDKDHAGEVISPDAIRKALPEYLRSGSIREMHTFAAGKPVNAFVDEEGKLHLTAKIVDASTITKIKEGILKSFSVGGKRLKQVGNTITELLLKEISVVDHGCNPACQFTICKVESTEHPTPTHNMKDELLKALQDPEVIAALAKLTPKTEQPKTEDLAKALGVEDLQKKLNTIEADAKAAKDIAAKAERDSIVAEASRDGKVIPLKDDTIAKMDITALKELVAGLPKTVATKKTTPKLEVPSKGDDLAKFLATKRAEGAALLDSTVFAAYQN